MIKVRRFAELVIDEASREALHTLTTKAAIDNDLAAVQSRLSAFDCHRPQHCGIHRQMV